MKFLEATKVTFLKQKELAEKAFFQVPFPKWKEPLSEETNSIAVIMKHVSGNLKSRWTDFLTTDGEKPWRNRDEEFVDYFTTQEEAIEFWEAGWSVLTGTMDSLSENDLSQTIYIRGEPHSVFLATQRSLAHTAYHVGQIVQTARVLAGDDWGSHHNC